MKITGISSMATRQVLADLVALFERASGHTVAIESVGGVDAAKRVQAGEAFDVVVLASNAIEQLVAAGKLDAASRVDIVRSGVALAVRAGAPRPPIATEDDVLRAVRAARTIGYSTGPSGVALQQLFGRWGIAEELKPRTVQAKAGVPVGALVASGEVELGFQQLSELLNVEGITVLGPMPDAIQVITTFSAAVGTASAVPAVAADLLAFMASPQADEAKRRHGMEPAG